MVTFNEAVESSARSGLCFLLGQFDEASRFLVRVVGTSGGIAPFAAGLRRKLCSDDPENDPVYVPEFSGGQCPGVNYLFNVTGTVPGSSPQTFNVTRIGPTSFDRSLQPGDNCDGITPPQVFRRWVLVGANGPVNVWSGCGASLTVNSVTPLSGGANNCGDPPPPPPGPPGDIIYEGPDITYNIDESTDITVPISFVFSPVYLDLDGSLKIPVNFDVGGVTFDGTIEVSPQFNFEFNPSGIDGGPGTVDDPDGIGEPGEPSDPVPDPEEGTLPIIGVLVYSDIDADGDPSGILFPTGPNIYVPRLASVTFAVQTANSIGWTSDQDVKNLECYVPCPAPQGAIAVRVSPMRGVTSRFTPVRGRVLTPDP